MGGLFLLILLISSTLVALNFRPIGAQTATITEVRTASLVRAGETFEVIILGDYETNAPITIDANVIESGGGGLGCTA
jgi:hypothetical protein